MPGENLIEGLGVSGGFLTMLYFSLRNAIREIITLTLLGAASISLHSQTFGPTQPLFFTKACGGANPLPQTIPVISTGSDFRFSTTPSTSSGGNWLSVTGVGCSYGCGATPDGVAAVVSPAINLATRTSTDRSSLLAARIL